MRTKGDGNVTNPQPKKILELNVYGSPSVSGVFITSHFPLRWNTHAQTRYTFISLLAELYVAEYQTPPFPKCDPLRFTSSIKTFQWSWDSVLSPCTKAPPMGRHSSPQKWKKQNAAVMKNTSSFRPLQQIFPPFSLDIILFPQQAQMQSVTHSCDPDTQRPTHTCFMVPQDVSLTPHHFQEIARTHVQIGRLMSGMSASGHAQKHPWLR